MRVSARLLIALSLALTIIACNSSRDYTSTTLEGFTVEYPEGWSVGAPALPTRSCESCTTIGPANGGDPHGVQLWMGDHELGCDLQCQFDMRSLVHGSAERIDVNGNDALRQEFTRQPPQDAADDAKSYRQIVVVVPMGGLASDFGRRVPALFIEGFYPEDDDNAEDETRESLDHLLDTLVVPESW